jgi:hypothetical protein
MVVLATQSVVQPFASSKLEGLLCACLAFTYNAIHHCEVEGISNRKGMKRFYRSLDGVELPSCYKVAIITRARSVQKSREKPRKRGIGIHHSKALRPMICMTNRFGLGSKS